MMLLRGCILFLLAELLQSQKTVTDSDLQSLTERLLNNDVNNAARYVVLTTQGRLNSGSRVDAAPQPLITVDKNVFDIPTVAKLLKLYDNYVPDARIQEDVTPSEKSEESAFLDAVLNTTVMSITKSWLQSFDLVPKNDRGFRQVIEVMWFTVYPRGFRKKSSSGFEHVFLAELKNGEISGFHNWLYFNHEEKHNNMNYLGWRKKLDFSNNRGSIIKATYNWNNASKDVGTMLIGTSPELELSLYTVCALIKPNNKCHISLGGKKIDLQTYVFTDKSNRTLIASAYPSF